jgi:transposase
MIDLSLEHMQYIEKQILRLDKQIDQHIEPYRKQFELLQTIPGIGATASASVLAEMGPDTAPFDDDSKLASWAGICPGNNESAGKKFGTNTRKGNRYLVSTVVGMRLGFHPPERIPHFKERYYRIRARRGPQRAIVAVGHTLTRTIFHVLKTGKPYEEPTRPLLTENQRLRKAQRLSKELRKLGYDVTLNSQPA